jgi:hypothetical protein
MASEIEKVSENTSKFVNSVFEQPWWLDTVAPNEWKEIIVEEEGETLARWPIVESPEGIGMPKMTQTLGFWLSEKILESDICYNQRKKITNLLLEQLPHNTSINICLDSRVDYFLPMHWKHFNVSPHISYRLYDLTDLDAIFNRFSGIVKENIKRANKKVTIKPIDDIEILLLLLDRTFSRQNMKNPWSKDLIRNIYTTSKENNACHLLYAQDADGNIHSGNLFVYCEKVCYDLISGTDPKYRSTGAPTLLVWEGIKFASTVSKSFDFEGSMIEGIENFLRQFGGKPIVYYQIQKQKLGLIKGIYSGIVKFLKDTIKSLIGYNNWYKKPAA